jgi:hypothetical protein
LDLKIIWSSAGCTNFRISTIEDHETSAMHRNAIAIETAKSALASASDIRAMDAGKALMSLKTAEKARIMYLMRNAHAVIKHNRPISDYTWPCMLDRTKELDIGQTYLNNKAALEFIKAIAAVESNKTVKILQNANFFSIMMDGSTDISGDEQEALYIRMGVGGRPLERCLAIGSPYSTQSKDLEEFVLNKFDENGIDKGMYLFSLQTLAATLCSSSITAF